MKRFYVFIVAAISSCVMLCAQSNACYSNAYLFISPVNAHISNSSSSAASSVIESGRVAVVTSPDTYTFYHPDVAEGFTDDGGAFIKYFPPAQDIVDAQYVLRADFNKASKMVTVAHAMPAEWTRLKRYAFVPVANDEYALPITVRVIGLQANADVSLVTEVDYENDFSPLSYIVPDEIIEITMGDNAPIYCYRSSQVWLEDNNIGSDFSEMIMDERGNIFAKDENGILRAESRLSYVFGNIPEVDFFGWISATEVVLDDTLYVMKP